MDSERVATLAPSRPVIQALGVPIRMTSRVPLPAAVRAAMMTAWRDCTVTGPSPSDARDLDVPASLFDDSAQGLADLSTRVTLAALDAVRGTRLLLHAAGVAAPDGRVLAMVGPSGRGKTTATRFVGRHFGYVSDESVAIDSELTVFPYRKPLSVIVAGEPVKEQIAPGDLGLLPLPGAPLRLAAITLLERHPDAGRPRVQPCDLIDAICEMTPQISYLAELPSPLQYIARVVSRVGAVMRLVYRDAEDLPELITGIFAAPMPPPQSWSVVPNAAPAESRPDGIEDAILVDGRACILHRGTVTALDHRGSLAWTMRLRGATTPEIVDAAIAAFGRPDGADPCELIERTLEELALHGLLERA